MITLEHLKKSYQHNGRTVQALNDVSLHVDSGEIYGVVGQSGAGKSTLIRCVNLLERPDSGRVIVAGQELTTLSSSALFKARHKIGMIFQHFNLLSSRTVYRNIALPLELIGARESEIATKVQPLLELTGLEDKAVYYPAQLSGGQKQRVAIARALAAEPQVLLSDEATSALDPKTTEDILKLLKNINEKLGLTILMITHEMEVVKQICHKVALIESGQLVETSDVDGFFTTPTSELGKQFVAQIQRFELPDVYQKRIQSIGRYPLVKIRFVGSNVDEPILSTLTKRFA
ncbi:MAG: ATP-binding cassette domain-containing protein, partial [Cardiobacteriaceae bacterium]|nr:ATP-binding cassette domain-containing protein [Cardiobacteriaceae bacterium]